MRDLVDYYVEAGLRGGDLDTLVPLRLLRDRVEYLLTEHARLAHEVDERPWREVAVALGVTPSAVSAWDRALRRARPGAAPPPPRHSPRERYDQGSGAVANELGVANGQ